MTPVRVELMASAAGKIGGVTWHHLYLIAVDAAGAAAYLRAGPQCLPLEHVVGRTTQHGDALEDYEPSPAGPYGVITFLTGAYEPGGIDFDPVAANVTVASGPAAAPLWAKVQAAAQALQAEQIPYDPVGKGANWALMETLRRCGMNASLPPKRWAPGAKVIALDPMLLDVSTRRLGQAIVM
jgi:hypothetical protein